LHYCLFVNVLICYTFSTSFEVVCLIATAYLVYHMLYILSSTFLNFFRTCLFILCRFPRQLN
jgi:hypothetical protein